MSTFSTRDASGVLVVSFNDPSGLNDFRNTPLRDALFDLVQNRPQPRVALDMSRVDYLSSSGVAVLVGLKRRIETHEGRIALFGLQSAVQGLLHIMKLDRYFLIVDAEAEAVEQLPPSPSN
ncbi:STAS domain-containing protein [Planctomyces sp. SH-PL62]|uniref:STAS domain-containing protein n=1 Tax=Planctomyces sp. SH-PL62 TaxID=1636152 RepID=UPI00078EE121|nr:STAS domain-containing protein [Planctomyces sp. SH-PL62]AMV36950.1 Anti-sigma-B factor antagonist [Planctomyces sp. SH-PL62]